MIESPDEQLLLASAVAGDQTAIEQLLLVYYSPLERHVALKIPPHAGRHFSVDDVLQQVFSEVFRDVQRFEPRGAGAFFAWLRTIADHRTIDALRAAERQAAGQRLSWSAPAGEGSIRELIDAVHQDSKSPSRLAALHEAEQAIRVAIAGLPKDQAEVIGMRYLQGKSVAEIAADTERTEGAVRGLIHRGKLSLSQAMERSSRWLSSR